MYCGIDYGSKLAGTTAICFLKNNKLCIIQSQKNQDADEFIRQFINEYKVQSVFIDAPLSLPKVYSYIGEEYNFFYRKCDLIANAMSPMFLGGLTARAMKLKHENQDSHFYETYPAYLIKYLSLDGIDFKNVNDYITDFKIPVLTNKHQLDSFLAYYAGHRFMSGLHITIGDEKEGLIYI